MSTLSALVILAGGASTRMGQDKASLQLSNGEILLDHVANNLLSVANLTFISGNNITNQLNIPNINDQFKSRKGPVGGIISSITYLAKKYPLLRSIYFVAVDSPNLTVNLLKIFDSSSKSICYFAHNPLPIKINITPECIDSCYQLLEELEHLDGYSVKKFIDKISHHSDIDVFEVPDGNFFVNLNYFEEWEQYKYENTI